MNAPLNSHYKIEISSKYGATVLIILESRGGTGPSARNPEYAKQLLRILEILKINECDILGIDLLSTVAIKNLKNLLLELTYPILLNQSVSLEHVRKMIQSAQTKKGQRIGAKGGNSTKRIGIYVRTGPIISAVGIKAVLD